MSSLTPGERRLRETFNRLGREWRLIRYAEPEPGEVVHLTFDRDRQVENPLEIETSILGWGLYRINVPQGSGAVRSTYEVVPFVAWEGATLPVTGLEAWPHWWVIEPHRKDMSLWHEMHGLMGIPWP
jgi:hypothetical protein